MKVRERLRGVRWQGTEVGSLFRQEMGWKTSGFQFSAGLISEREKGTEGEIKQYCLGAFFTLGLFTCDGEVAVSPIYSNCAARMHTLGENIEYF